MATTSFGFEDLFFSVGSSLRVNDLNEIAGRVRHHREDCGTGVITSLEKVATSGVELRIKFASGIDDCVPSCRELI
jgi:hypothetical protein